MKKIVFPILFFSLQLSAQTIDLSNGLLAAYTFEPVDTTVSLADTSGHNNSLSSTRPVPVAAPARHNQAGSAIAIGRGTFGVNHKFLLHNPAVAYPSGNSPRSISLWFRKNGFDPNIEADIQFLMFYGGMQTNAGCGIAVDYVSQQIYFAGYQNDVVVNYPLLFGQWYHIAAVYDGTVAKLYVNGNLAGQATLPGWNTSGSDPRYGYLFYSIPTGGSQRHYQNIYEGYLDDILLYNRVLNQKEISILAEKTAIGMPLIPLLSGTVYPNPAADVIRIDSEGIPGDLRLHNPAGQLLWQAEEATQIDVSHLKGGIYILTYTINGTPHTARFVKQ